jgi:TRAP-type C4-dicarboxylate transport system substrate-binding protein
MKKREFLSAIAAGAAVASTPALAQADIPTLKLKVASNYPATSLFSRVQQFYLDEVTKRTGGKVTFEWFLGGVLLKAGDVYPGLARGAIDIGFTVPAAFNPREFPVSGVTLPFVTENPQAGCLAFRDWYRATPDVQKEFQRNNVHLLLTLSTSENVLWTMKQVNSAADLKGMRLRTLLGPGDAFAALGATAVTVPYTDAIDLLSRGGVDGISTTPFEQGVKDGLADMVNFLSNGGRMGIFATVMTSVNADKWKTFPKSLQDIFTTSADNALDWYIKAQNAETDESVEILRKSKRIQVVKLDPAEEKRWRDQTAPVIMKKYSDAVARVGGNAEQLTSSFNALARKYEAQHPYVPGIERYLAKK